MTLQACSTPEAWSADFETGHPLIDHDHRELVCLLNKIAPTAVSSADYTAYLDTIEQLVQHSNKHFALEEQLMRQHHYPDYAAHRASHERLALELQALVHRYTWGEIALSNAVLNLLRDWLLNHIRTGDRKLATFLKNLSAIPESIV